MAFRGRGGGYVLLQFLLLGALIWGPAEVFGQGRWPVLPGLRLAGVLFAILGVGLLTLSALWLGPALTPFPRPRSAGALVQTGPYAWVRHPIYTGLLLLALGIALWRGSWVTLGIAGLLFGLLDRKSRREERWLRERYPEYTAYQARVPKLIPWRWKPSRPSSE
jgi:protein-S-isoprenylcysteine O-methyltransferase Ste14